jgi:hypothetical protein
VSCYLSEITQQRASSTHFVEYKPVLQIYSCQYTACEFIIIPGIPIFMVNSYQDKKIKNLMLQQRRGLVERFVISYTMHSRKVENNNSENGK